MGVTVARNRRRVAVGDPESRHALFSSLPRRLDRLPEALPEADRDQQVFRGQDFDFVLQIAGAPDRRLSVKPKRRQPISQVI